MRTAAWFWPHAVFEDAESGKVYERYVDLGLRYRHEILVYRDRKALEQWDELGAEDSLIGTMIHLLLGASDITIVVDSSPPPQIQAYIKSVDDALRQDIFLVKATETGTTREAA